MCCNNRGWNGGFFWIVIVVALVILWVHYATCPTMGCGEMDGCGCNNGCFNGI